MIKSEKIKSILLQLSIVLSVLSQISEFAFLRTLMLASWGITIIFNIIKNEGKIKLHNFTVYFLIDFLIFVLYCLITGTFDNMHLENNYLYVLAVPLLMSILGEFYCDLSEKELKKCILTYIVFALIYAIWVNFTYFNSYKSWLNLQRYAFLQKNSAAQIWCIAMLLLIFVVKYKSFLGHFIGYVISLYFFIIIGICQCRTALLAISAIVVAYSILKSKKKIVISLVFVGIAILIWNVPFTRQFIDQAFLLNKYAGADLNTFSSNRLDLWEMALKHFSDSPIIGVGKYYVDCSYILILTESGIIGFILIESIWFYKMILNFKCNPLNVNANFLFCTTIFYIVESMLEGFPPFGPGVCSFMFWLISSISLNKDEEKNE